MRKMILTEDGLSAYILNIFVDIIVIKNNLFHYY